MDVVAAQGAVLLTASGRLWYVSHTQTYWYRHRYTKPHTSLNTGLLDTAAAVNRLIYLTLKVPSLPTPQEQLNIYAIICITGLILAIIVVI